MRGSSVSALVAAVLGWCGGENATDARAATETASAPRPFDAALHFERNEGQLDPEVKFALHGDGYGLYLTRSAATLALRRRDQPQQAISLRLLGARDVEPEGEVSLPGVTNYFVGNDRARWTGGVRSFARVRYRGVLPGVDLVYYGSGTRELEYDIELAAATSPRGVVMQVSGARSLRVDAGGDAVIELSDGAKLRKARPIAYQIDARGARRDVPARFRVEDDRALGFELGDYDRGRPVTIDPTIGYSTYLGGSRFDEMYAVGADAAGNTIAVGYTTGTLFPTRAPAQPTYGGGSSDAIVCKLKADGSGFVYATYLGGSDAERGYSVAVDAAGSAYVAGVTFSSDFPTIAPLQPARGGGQDAFITKLSASGAIVYSTYLGGAADDLALGVAVGATGEAYVAGATFSSNFPTVSAVQTALRGTSDAFVARLSAAGTSLSYSTYLGGSGNEQAQGLTVNSVGAVFVVGQTGSSDFPTSSPVQPSFGGGVSDAFVTQLAANGRVLAYSTYLGGTLPDVATAVTEVGGAAIVAGYTSSFDFPLVASEQPALGGSSDAFVSRISAGGGSLDYSVYLGGSGADNATSVVVDPNSYVYVGGQTASPNFPLEAPLSGQTSRRGPNDGFVAAFANGGSRVWSSYLGGSSTDSVVGVALGGPTTLHVLGSTLSADVPIVGLPLFGTAPGPQDGFVARLTTLSPTPAPAGGPGFAVLLALALLAGAWAVKSRLPARG